jgi:hypothetical protein
MNREFWKKHIFGKKIYDNGNYQIYVDWEDGLVYHTSRIAWFSAPKQTKLYMKQRKDRKWGFYLKSVIFSYVTLLDVENYGNDPFFPILKSSDTGSYSTDFLYLYSESFQKGFDYLKEKLSFFNDMYLPSKYLPPELVAHVFSFVRRCEIEKL